MNLSYSYDDVSKIVESSRDRIENNRNYTFLHKGILQKLWDNKINKSSYFCIYLESDIIDQLKIEELKENIEKINDHIKTCNFIQIDYVGNVINRSYKDCTSEKIKMELSNLSLKNLVFFFGEEGITRYINGRAVEDNNIFYSRKDRMNYLKKKDISQLDEVIHDYAVKNVSQQINYMCFFADNSTLNQINPQYVSRNILKNKPEHFMRDHLREYLKENMKYTFTIEPELGQSKRELDIYFDVSGELYFIEVKWLGVSINDLGTDLSKPYTAYRAREGVIQSLEYIKELINTSETSLRCGCLAIFDARDKKKEIDFKYDLISEELKQYMKLFKLLEIIPLEKKHPA
jgi:hypothetical protein